MPESLSSRWGIAVETQAETIVRLREWMDLTQEDLAKALGKARMTVVRWETGQTTPSAEDILALGEKFSIVLAGTLVILKREARTRLGLPLDIPAFDSFRENTKDRMRLIAFAMLGGGKVVMPASLWCEVLDIEPSVLKDVPGEAPADPLVPSSTNSWRLAITAEPAPLGENRMLLGFNVAGALDAALRGRSFTVPKDVVLRGHLARRWVTRLINELDDRIERYGLEARSPLLRTGDRAVDVLDERRVQAAIRLEERRQKERGEAAATANAPRTAARRRKKPKVR